MWQELVRPRIPSQKHIYRSHVFVVGFQADLAGSDSLPSCLYQPSSSLLPLGSFCRNERDRWELTDQAGAGPHVVDRPWLSRVRAPPQPPSVHPTCQLTGRHALSALAVRWEATLRIHGPKGFSLQDVAKMSAVDEADGSLVSPRPARLRGERDPVSGWGRVGYYRGTVP